METIEKNGLKVNKILYDFVNDEAIHETNINSEEFWKKFSNAIHELSPINKNLIEKREIIQKKIDEWHKSNREKEFSKNEYINFLKSINYLIEEKDDFKIETSNVDEEISSIAGPQLVVPVDNARYALNAANARWGSLYDALYGTDVIKGDKAKGYNKERAAKVIEYTRNFFDKNFPLSKISWHEINKIYIKDDKLIFSKGKEIDELKDKDQFIGYNGDKENPSSI